ncbi:hypothetical protein IAT40_003561 [Kwoniella sp. CBS 6097]
MALGKGNQGSQTPSDRFSQLTSKLRRPRAREDSTPVSATPAADVRQAVTRDTNAPIPMEPTVHFALDQTRRSRFDSLSDSEWGFLARDPSRHARSYV